jgi:2-polyprenyl-6-hydroxyphenyl methylase/3-demethylubiquinone-9 3-methyltransferase
MQDSGTLSQAEIAQFDRLADAWWDPRGPMRPLHAMNPLRADWIARRIGRDRQDAGSLLDVGCGAGLLSEALAAKGFTVTGLDAAPAAIAAARAHAEGQDLPVTYRCGRIEELIAEGLVFPVVTALEVVEHVPDVEIFIGLLAQLVAPGGLLFISTLNRSLRALLTAKIGAEYIVRLLPRGTHDWRRFLPPARLAALTQAAGLRVTETAGLSYDVWRGRWRETSDLSMNYILAATKAGLPLD